MADTLARRCTVEADGKRCGRPTRSRQMCYVHLTRWKETGSAGPVELPSQGSRICSEPDCGEPHLSKGFCSGHYSQVAKYGRTRPITRHFARRRITDDEMAIIADLSVPRVEVASRLGVTLNTVTAWRRKVKYHLLRVSDWNDDEVDFIIDKLNTMRTEDIAVALGRDRRQVQSEINRLRTHGFVPKRSNARLDPWIVSSRTLIAKTCPSCGHLLGAEFFSTEKSGSKKLYASHCRKCKSVKPGQSEASCDRHRQLHRTNEYRLQALTIDRAENSGKEYTSADLDILASPGKTTLQKALELRRTYFAVAGALSKRGLTSKPDEIPSPEDSAWQIFWDMEVPEGEVSHA